MKTDASTFLSAKHVTFRYFEQEQQPTIQDASMEITAGTTTVITGNSGCGKSTLAAIWTGLYPENGGELLDGDIRICGQKLFSLTPASRSRLLAMMFQNPDLQFCMRTLRRELIFCLENLSVPKEDMDARIDNFSRKLSIEPLLDRDLHTLSGGEKQKAALCCLLLLRPKGILLDEPFANIDEYAALEIMALLRKAQEEHGTTLIVIDHKLEHWMAAADEFILLGEHGHIIKRDITPETLPAYQALFEQEGVAWPLAAKTVYTERALADPFLQLKNTSIFAPGSKPALLDNVHMDLYPGHIHALIGPSGSGKTTLFLTLLGRYFYEGSILWNRKELRRVAKKEFGRQIGIVFQNPSGQFVTTRVLDEVLISLKIWNPGKSEDILKEKARKLLDDYGLLRCQNYSPYMLSQGQQRRLAVLSMLAGGQRILLLDEPTYGQDARSTQAIMKQLTEKVKTEKLTVLFTTHDRELALKYADRIYTTQERTVLPWNG